MQLKQLIGELNRDFAKGYKKGFLDGQARKGRTVLVRCLIVNSDGDAVDKNGELLGAGKPLYEWQKRYRTTRWLKKHKSMWKAIR
jgi:hypothetical protein